MPPESPPGPETATRPETATPSGTGQADGTPSLRGLLAEHYIPGTENLEPRKRRRVVLSIAVIGTIFLSFSAIVATAIGIYAEKQTAKPRMRAEQAAEEELENEQEPLTGTIDYDTSLPADFIIALDRTLTRQEQKKIEQVSIHDHEWFWNYLRPRGGRLIRFPSVLFPSPPRYNPRVGSSTSFRMNLFTERQSQLSIVDMRAVNVECREPTAKTIVVFPPQGEGTYPGVIFDLAQKNAEPALTEGADTGKPYFSGRKIDLGPGLSPGGLKVEAKTPGLSCTWEIAARYRDSTGEPGRTILKDGDKPLFAEDVPKSPRQYWTADYRGHLVPCHERHSPLCLDDFMRRSP
ncbi:hypothetical protein ACWF94_22330 [Streptomyces sp. NPDC055078]